MQEGSGGCDGCLIIGKLLSLPDTEPVVLGNLAVDGSEPSRVKFLRQRRRQATVEHETNAIVPFTTVACIWPAFRREVRVDMQ